MPRHPFRAFTLIELMIVVAVFAVISAILVPNFIRAREKARQVARAQAEKKAPVPLPEGAPPLLDGARVDLAMQVVPLRVGLDVANRYALEHQSVFHWSAGGSGERLILFVLPEGVDQVDSLAFEVADGDSWKEPAGVIYGPDFVAWKAPAQAFPLTTRLDYRASGSDKLLYLWPAASKIREVQAQLDLQADGGQAELPLGSLRPSEHKGSTYLWRLQNVLSPAPIEVELSALDSPLGQAGRLFRMTGLALLLFGAGFWYLAELYRVGSLKDFRFGSFFLLALTYSSFFVSAAVLGVDGRWSPPAYLSLSLLLSLPLLLFHVSQLVDARFALTRAVPLTLATLSLVLLGVYGGSARPLGFLGLSMLGVAFLTTTYQPFRRAQDERRSRSELALRRAHEEEALLRRDGSKLALEMMSLLEDKARKMGKTHRADLRARLANLQKALDSSLPTTLEGCEWSSGVLRTALERAREACQRVPAPEERVCQGPESAPHCCYCGAPGAGGNYCSQCGKRAQVTRTCSACQTVVHVPVPLLPAGQGYHCHGCGHRVLRELDL